MKRATSFFLAFVSLLVLPPTVQAQLFRAYVASYGNDANPCTVVAPCRLVPAALNAVASGGEIWILDSANFNTGTVDINKSVAIAAVPGAVGSIVAVGGNAAIILHTAGVRASLRNVVITNNAVNPGSVGIAMTDGSALTVEHCLLQGLPQQAILVGGNPVNVYIKDSEIRDGNNVAIDAQDGAYVDVVRTKMTENRTGAVAAETSTATGVAAVSVTDSEISGRNGNGSAGLFASAHASGGAATIYANRVSISNVDYAMITSGLGSPAIQIGSSMVVHNGTNIYEASGRIWSLGNNHISDAKFADVGPLTPLTPR